MQTFMEYQEAIRVFDDAFDTPNEEVATNACNPVD